MVVSLHAFSGQEPQVCLPARGSHRSARLSFRTTAKAKKELPESWLWQSLLAIAASRRCSRASSSIVRLVWGDVSVTALGLKRARARQAMMLVKLMELQLKI